MKYIKSIWEGNSRITPQKMNKIENQLEYLTNRVEFLENELKRLQVIDQTKQIEQAICEHNQSQVAHRVVLENLRKNKK